MKKISLALCSALLLPSISLATPLDEAIKDVDVSGFFRYRYDSASGTYWTKSRGFEGSPRAIKQGPQTTTIFFNPGRGDRQNHNYFSVLGFNAAIADNFKAFIQLRYGSTDSGFSDGGSNTTENFQLQQYFFTYTAPDLNTDVIAGKQQVDSIWTDNSPEGLIGTGIKVVNTSIDGLSLLAFAFDNFNVGVGGSEGDVNEFVTLRAVNGEIEIEKARDNKGKVISPYDQNLYGVAALGNFEANGIGLAPQLWLSYLNDSALFYAFTLGISTTLFEDAQWSLAAAYLGNSMDDTLKRFVDFKNNNFFGLSGTINFAGFDASLGGFYYGDKNHYTMTTLEDRGNLGDFLAGEKLLDSDGSRLFGDLGQNTFGFIKAGYTFNEVLRIGGDLLYGGTKVGNNDLANGQAGKKFEAVARISYQYTPKLSFSAFYSYVNIDAKREDSHRNTSRLQVLYQF